MRRGPARARNKAVSRDERDEATFKTLKQLLVKSLSLRRCVQPVLTEKVLR
jgi:hypothetical protein